MAKAWKEVKEALQEKYPGMAKAVFSMGKNPKYYGVEHVEYVKRVAAEVEPILYAKNKEDHDDS